MRQSKLFLKTSKTVSGDDVSTNARLLEQGGFIYKNSAGIYTYLPLGWRVIQKIRQIIREEMDAIDGQEMAMPSLNDKRYLTATGRWDVDVVYKVITGQDPDPKYNISWTNEEMISEIASHQVNSYKDLPLAIYQMQNKYRFEARPKSGLLRGREFIMKDLYSFHATQKDFEKYYLEVKDAYLRIFDRIGIKAYYTLASGGDFTGNYTHEFQTLAEVGEDEIMLCQTCELAENVEVSKLKAGDKCKHCDGEITKHKSIEVGNIFPLSTKYSEAFNLKFKNDQGEQEFVIMGSYGIGVGRAMGTAVEISHDENGIIWPEQIAPYQAHLILIGNKNETTVAAADQLYQNLQTAGVEVLYDDRASASPGQKLADSDLLGIPYRVVISDKTVMEKKVEFKKRSIAESELITEKDLIDKLT